FARRDGAAAAHRRTGSGRGARRARCRAGRDGGAAHGTGRAARRARPRRGTGESARGPGSRGAGHGGRGGSRGRRRPRGRRPAGCGVPRRAGARAGRGGDPRRVVAPPAARAARVARARQSGLSANSGGGMILPLGRKNGRPSAIMLGDRARDAGDWHAAARHYRTALERNPARAPIWVQYGHALKESGFLAQAEAAYLRALVLHPALPDVPEELRGLGWSEAMVGELAVVANPDAARPTKRV